VLEFVRDWWWNATALLTNRAIHGMIAPGLWKRYGIKIKQTDWVVLRQFLVRQMADSLAASYGLPAVPTRSGGDLLGVRPGEEEKAEGWWGWRWVYSSLSPTTQQKISSAITNGKMGATDLEDVLRQTASSLAVGSGSKLGKSLKTRYDKQMLPAFVKIFSDSIGSDRYNDPIREIMHNMTKRDMVRVIWDRALLSVNPDLQFRAVTGEQPPIKMVPRPLFDKPPKKEGGGKPKGKPKYKGRK
jgi:hypothetical protein